MNKDRFALVSVSNKTNILDFVKVLVKHNYKIISTGGTAEYIKENGFDVIEAGDYTNMKQSRLLKTMHHKVSGGLFYAGDDEESVQFRKDLELDKITIVVNNFYIEDKNDFFGTIDVGGPTMTRTAAKMGVLNGSVAVVTSPNQYENIAKTMDENNGEVPVQIKRALSIDAFKLLRDYNIGIIDKCMKHAVKNPDWAKFE
jgi:phosphoribosylaminoimidazolecarboxamide formyltransferase / IMP cyclohydrolase